MLRYSPDSKNQSFSNMNKGFEKNVKELMLLYIPEVKYATAPPNAAPIKSPIRPNDPKMAVKILVIAAPLTV